MKTIETTADSTMEMVWAICEKINEETKSMTDQQWIEYVTNGSRDFHNEIEQIRKERLKQAECVK